MKLNRRYLMIPLFAFAAWGLSACGSTPVASSDNSGGSSSGQSAKLASSDTTPVAWTMYVFRGAQHIVGPDGAGHDAIVPASIVVPAGKEVTLTVINYDEGPHTITSPDANIDLFINPGKQQPDGSVTPVSTTLTFTITKAGVYRWYCSTPCDAGHGGWAMTKGFGGDDQEGFMAGNIVAL